MVIAIATQRGGVGKTTSTVALAQAAAHKGVKTLAVDLDPQGHTSMLLAADTARPGAYELLNGQPVRDTIQQLSGALDAIPASANLQSISSAQGSARRLRTALAAVAHSYGLIIIDTPPTAGELQYNALMAADLVIVPMQAELGSLQGLIQLAETVQLVRRGNADLRIAGYILARYSGRSNLAKSMAAAIQSRAAEMDIPHLATIREAVAIQEAQALRRDLYEYAPKSRPAVDYMALCEKILEACQ